jgi:predicted permease
LRARIAAIPQAASVALATAMPLSNAVGWFRTDIEGRPPVGSDYNAISPTFFQTLGTAVVRGRGFTAEDREGGAPVALVNEEFARRYWPGEEAIGKRIRLTTSATFFEVVGVAPDFEDASADFNSVRPTIYVPQSQAALFLRGAHPETPPYEMQLLVRAVGDAAALKTAMRQEARAADPHLRVTIQTVEEMIDSWLRPLRTISMMLTVLGALALLMASVGIYAILAYAVSQRTREIGIRMALGARRGEIVLMIMRRTSVLIAWGIAIGLGGALLLSRVMASSLAQLGHLDAPTCMAVSLLLAAVALTASYLPARKALRVDPAESLRSE